MTADPEQDWDAEEEPDDEGKKTAIGTDEDLAGALCYLLWWVTGLIFLLVEKDNEYVRFHAMQSIVTSAAMLVAFIVLSVLSVIPFLTAVCFLLMGLIIVGSFPLWLFLMYKSFWRHERFKLPWIGDFAENHI
jgi:uncharacterized membrane protein